MSSRPSTAPHALQRNGRASSFACIPSLKDFVFTEKLGSGTYATVYKAFRKNGGRETVAIKCIQKKSLNRTSTENLLTEIELLKLLKHRHIVELKDIDWDFQYIYLIMEYCGGGDLLKCLRSKHALHERTARKFLQQIASALQYMREKNVAHLDLKPQNILISTTNPPCLKIAASSVTTQDLSVVYPILRLKGVLKHDLTNFNINPVLWTIMSKDQDRQRSAVCTGQLINTWACLNKLKRRRTPQSTIDD